MDRVVTGRDALLLSCAVLQRLRRGDRRAGVWEPADLQWWWRVERVTDGLPQTVLFDAGGPAATVRVTAWRHGWQLDVLRASPSTVSWARLADPVWERLVRDGPDTVECLVRADDGEAVEWLVGHGFEVDGHDHQAWLRSADRPVVPALADGYRLVDRRTRPAGTHPLAARSGPQVEARLAGCPLYDPGLDLAILAPDGTVAGYSLHWSDPVTGIGLVEPVRVEDEHAGRGLGYAMVATGLQRLADRGADLLKIGWETERAGELYTRLGFVDTASCTTFRWHRPAPAHRR